MDHLRPAERTEGPVHRRRCSLGCVSAIPGVTNQAPTDFSARPPFRVPRSQASNPTARCLLDHREHRKALQVPRASHQHESAPSECARLRTANKMRRLSVGHESRPRTEVLHAGRAQQQSRGIELEEVRTHKDDFITADLFRIKELRRREFHSSASDAHETAAGLHLIAASVFNAIRPSSASEFASHYLSGSPRSQARAR
jgi:hypothetical protein